MNWRTQPLAIIDTETTGTDPARHRVVEVAIRIVSPGQEPFCKSWLVDPGTPIPAEATAIHGITTGMLADAPIFHEVAHELWMLISACIPVAYNARFDRAMLLAEYLRARIDPPEFLFAPPTWIDVLAFARNSKNRGDPHTSGRFKLGAVAARYGVPIGTAHRAAGDCETTHGVLTALAAEPTTMPSDLALLLAKQKKHQTRFDEFMANKAFEDMTKQTKREAA
jgi:DNA polymerase-3 subunit epsilon